ncbi:hypothetical protein BDV12DRAFT_210380 [Aspergillus spectabilis]
MIFIIPLVLAIAGVALILTRRRYLALREKQPAQVIVKGDTYSESVDKTYNASLSRPKIEIVRQCCIIGAGRAAATTGIALASRNPEVQFCVVDTDERVINAWNSDTLPVFEPGLEEIFFDDQCINARSERGQGGSTDQIVFNNCERRRKLSNLIFSTNIHAAVSAAELIFLCIEMDSTGPIGTDPFAYLDTTLQAIAHASRGHKIIVQRTTAPYGVTAYIKKQLTCLSSPTAIFTTLVNPLFSLPGSLVHDTLNPDRIVIGHIYTPDSSGSCIAALKGVYTSFVPDERVVTMDAWSVELGRIGSMALLAQRGISASSLVSISRDTEAGVGRVGWIVGCDVLKGGSGRGGLSPWLRAEIRCLVYLARGRGMDVAGYWEGVLRMEEEGWRRDVGRLLSMFGGGIAKRKVAIICGMEGQEMEKVGVVLRELGEAGMGASVWSGDGEKKAEDVLRALKCDRDEIAVAGSLEDACSGCDAVIVCGMIMVRDEIWQRIANQMEAPKVLLDMTMGMDRMQMQQLGFEMV